LRLLKKLFGKMNFALQAHRILFLFGNLVVRSGIIYYARDFSTASLGEDLGEGMKKQKRMILEGIAVGAGIIVVLAGAAPLFETNGAAIVLSVIIGAFGVGAAFASLMKDLKKFSE